MRTFNTPTIYISTTSQVEDFKRHTRAATSKEGVLTACQEIALGEVDLWLSDECAMLILSPCSYSYGDKYANYTIVFIDNSLKDLLDWASGTKSPSPSLIRFF
jgi:hypothetical protein